MENNLLIKLLFAWFLADIDNPIWAYTNILHKTGLLNQRIHPSKNKIEQFILDCVFEYTDTRKVITKKDIRILVKLKKDAFINYFGNFLKENGWFHRRVFTLREFYQILIFWQGKNNTWQTERYSKSDLAEICTNGSLEELAILMPDVLKISASDYKKHHFFSPKTAKKVVLEILDTNGDQELKELISEVHSGNDVDVIMGILLLSKLYIKHP